MSDKSNEQISNLMDGELEINASRFLLKRMATDDSLSETWDSYHLIKSCLQKKDNEPLIDVSGIVCQKLTNSGEQHQDIINPIIDKKVHPIQRWLKPVIGAGIAASVAIVSVFMLQGQKVDGYENQPQLNIVNNNDIQPLKTNISANVATSGKTIVPPVSLSRFPSVSNGQGAQQHQQGLQSSNHMPYIFIINQSDQTKTYSPMRIEDISD